MTTRIEMAISCFILALSFISIGYGQTCVGGYWDISSNIWFRDCTDWDQYDGLYRNEGSSDEHPGYSVTVDGDTTFLLADNSSQTIYWRLYWFDNIVDANLPVPDSVPLLAGVHCWEESWANGIDELPWLFGSCLTYLRSEPGAMRVISLSFSINASNTNSGTWWWGGRVNNVPTSWAEDAIIQLTRDRIKDGAQLLANAGATALAGKHVDANRVYLRGHSMGGTGTYRIGIKYPDVFAAIHAHAGFADFKGPCGAFTESFDNKIGTSGEQCRGIDGNQYVARDYTDMSWFVRQHKGASWETAFGQGRTYEPPYVCMTHGSNDDAVDIASADRVHHVLDSLKYGCTFMRHGGGHSDNNGTRSQWMLNFRKDQSYLALTNNSTNTPDHFNYLDQIGWQPASIIDETNHYEVQMTGTAGTTDVTLRRLQKFIVTPDKAFHYWIGAQTGEGIAVSADENSALTLAGIAAGSKLIIEPDVFSRKDAVENIGKQNFEILAAPNPFNPSTKIVVSGQRIAGGQNVSIKIYSLQGKMVQELPTANCLLSAGITWDASSQPSGIYVVRAQFGNHIVSKAITLMK